MRIRDSLLKSLREASVFNPEVQVAPACILWPDRDRQWEAVMPSLQAELSELFVLGDYSPEKRIGPAIWLRCVIAGVVDEASQLEDQIPIIYLPGVSRQDLRAVESCPEHLKPLAELQYRGLIWSQLNAKDWTVLAYLKSLEGGLGLDVAQDSDAKNAMQLALAQLLDEDATLLQGKRLDRDFFNTLLTGGDPIRDLLQWLDQGDDFKKNRGQSEWKAFVEVAKSQLAFDPDKDGVLAGAAKFAKREGPWGAVWERYCEAPKRYPNIPKQIRKNPLPEFDLFTDESIAGSWPQWNQQQEEKLSSALLSLADYPAHQARQEILGLEKTHGGRRALVWNELGESTFVAALEQLTEIARLTEVSLAAGSMMDLLARYETHGWLVDSAVLGALSNVSQASDLLPIQTAIRSVYMPWLEDSARHLQKIWKTDFRSEEHPVSDECVLFVDGLRFDCGKRLSEKLKNTSYDVEEKPIWAALPSVTGTGKPAVAPFDRHSNRIQEEPSGFNFELMSTYQLRKAIEDNGFTIAEKKAHDFPEASENKRLWVEFGDIDNEGHERGWKLAKHVDGLLEEIKGCVDELFRAGWARVRIVTDHGWLLLPGGLPKTDLPAALVDTKWGRCASLKPGSVSNERLFPWYWNSDQHFALADGISCFKSGEEYTHGGLSLQECLTLQLTVTRGDAGDRADSVIFSEIVWKGLRCKVAVEGQHSELSVDVRLNAGDASTSVALAAKKLNSDGFASVLIDDEDLEGKQAAVVLIDQYGSLVLQVDAIIGGGNS